MIDDEKKKVLTMPKSESSVLYYKRKISWSYLTIYNLVTQEGFCFVWDEAIAKREANEISSYLWHYIEEQTRNKKNGFHFYSDNCGGQNRNNMLFTMYTKPLIDFDITITHRCFTFIKKKTSLTFNLNWTIFRIFFQI